jgi:hypothetical protein
MSTRCCARTIRRLKVNRTRPTRVARWSACVAKVVSARTGLSQADAEKRVNDVVTQVKADLDAARKAAMQTAIWLTLSLFIGAFSASLAATEGGGLRGGTWGKKAYTPAINR